MTLFDYAESKKCRDQGMDIATQGRAEALMRARVLALNIVRLNGRVTADDVRREYEYRGRDWSELGNAAGSIFKGNDWKCVGFENSSVATSHARALRVWELK
jgi:hypothetical protein